MDAFVKSFSTYRTIKKATSLSSALTLDSLDPENSTVTVRGTEINRSDTGNWLVIDGQIYQISNVKPQNDRTLLTLVSPLDAFSRPLELESWSAGATIGSFIHDMLVTHWQQCQDPDYSMPYLTVSYEETPAMVSPELDSTGCYQLSDYIRLMRKSYRVKVTFQDVGHSLECNISVYPVTARKVSFEDGHGQLQSVDYSASGMAKLTVLQDVETGEKDENGDKIYERHRSIWYLAEDGSVSQTIPARRASGEWGTIQVKGNQDVQEKVIETFAKNKANHKLEFWSDRDLQVQDDCTFHVYGETLLSYISYKRKASTDRRFYYKSGELATTAAEKLKGVTK